MDQRTTIKLLDDTFNHDFDILRYLTFVKELFNNFQIKEYTSTVWNEFSDYIDSYKSYGTYIDTKKKVLDILVVKLKKTTSRDRARTMQRNFIAKYLGNAEKDAALVAFYGDDPQDWRFSFVKMEYQLVKDGEKVKVSKELTPAKRYSFLVGKNEPNYTCRRQFLSLVMEEEVSPSLGEIEQAFSIDNVTKEFFSEYKELFLKLKESLERVLESDKRVKKEFEEKNISSVDFGKKLLGQIVFIYFLQKKGWLGVTKDKSGAFNHWGTGPKNFLRRLFDKEIVHYDNFFNDILEPLFYEALATERDDDYYSRFTCKIPFLNGGLFEPINDYDWAGTAIVLDNAIFGNIFSIFDRFNFTVKEDEPLEKEVAVDPEMLGKVFENLLDVTDRKSKGAFYTPREIVHYMCQQSLINYLETNSGILREDIEKFIQEGDLTLASSIRVLQEVDKKQEKLKNGIISSKIFEEEVKRELEKLDLPQSIVENRVLLDKLLKEIKVVDPAVGSGAFPVGMMNEIVRARSILSIYFKEARNEYELKRETIENCLYGVDIDSSAVDIAKLRFWLSLIVDELDMKNIKPLPNLDHKIMCGNSLLEEFEGKKLFDEKLLGEVKKDYSVEIKQLDSQIAELHKEKGEIARGKRNGNSIKDIEKQVKVLENKKQKLLFGNKEKVKDTTLEDSISKRIKESQKKLSELKELQRKFFNEQNRKLKRRYRDDIERLEWDLIEETLKEEGNSSAMEKLQEYKKNKSKPFFLWKLYFAEVFQEKGGFDIVIANPPYINALEMKRSIDSTILNSYKKNYKTAKGTVDIYIFFFELGINIMNKKGYLAYITPNKYLSAPYGVGLREFIYENATVDHFVNVAHIGVFSEAAVYPILTFIASNGGSNKFTTKTPKNNMLSDVEAKQFNIKIFPIDSLSKYPDKIWGFVLSHGFEILEKIVAISFQMNTVAKVNATTTANEADAFSKLITNKKSEGLFRVLNTGTIDKYISLWSKKQLKNAGESFLTPYLKENKLISDYRMKMYKSPKILFAKIAKHAEAFIDLKGEYAALNSNCIYDINKDYDIRFVGGFCNSTLFQFIYGIYFGGTRMGGGYFQFQAPQLRIVPIIMANRIQSQKEIIKLVDAILNITKEDDYLDNPDKQAKVKRLEKEIDQLVYKLYELNPEEIKIVEGFGK